MHYSITIFFYYLVDWLICRQQFELYYLFVSRYGCGVYFQFFGSMIKLVQV